MIKRIFLRIIIFAFVGLYLSSCANEQVITTASLLDDSRQVQFAERVISIELVKALSPAVSKERKLCISSCPETGALELAIGLLGVSRSDASADMLVSLLGMRLDGAGSEELSCQILLRGNSLAHRMKRFQPKQIAEHCQSIIIELQKRELKNIGDVNIDQVCHSESEIKNAQEKWINAIKSKETCEQ